MCDMPSPAMDVTCPFCWWRGKRKYYFENDPQKKPCPACGGKVSGGWLFKTPFVKAHDASSLQPHQNPRKIYSLTRPPTTGYNQT